MDLLSEDDDLLSYFLSADIASEASDGDKDSLISAQHQTFVGLGGNTANVDQFTFGQQTTNLHQDPQPHGGNGSLSALQQIQHSLNRDSATSKAADDFSDTASVTSSALDNDEKRQRRLARNRESARQSRRRKKQYLELLEEKVSQLTESIDITRANHLKNADESLNKVRSEILSSVLEEAKNASVEGSSEKLKEAIRLIQERFGPNSIERIAVKEYNFRQLDNLLLPPYCRLLLWLSIQDDRFFDESAGNSLKQNPGESGDKKKQNLSVKKDALWPTLINDLSLTYEQDEKLKALYKSGESKASKSERRKIALAVTYLSKLKNSLEARAQAVQRHSDTIHSILTPEQSLKYLRWVDANQGRLKGVIEKSDIISASGASPSIQTILKKNDRDLTVEDVTALLNEL